MSETCTQDLIAQLKTGKEKDILKEYIPNVNEMSQEDCIISMIQGEGFRATRTVNLTSFKIIESVRNSFS